MGHSQTEKKSNHERIVRTAARRLREKGLETVAIADVMKEVGLTVGGFYKHFGSRDDLVVEALQAAVGPWEHPLKQAASGGGPSPSLAGLIDDYLSEKHRDRPGSGCTIGALAGDVARSNKRVRALATERIRSALDLIGGLLPDKGQETATKKAALIYSALVGALALSRAVSDESLSNEILESTRELLKSQLSS
ncbi:MAG: TetR/AcrR family transcriptional regulator [Verrucomicrobia bacterium]|nr:TetR/AcrR family transcriptional regulator [Verrucomicrobiota bacterium]MBV8274865.1 TetR/AcrR family transcriptional regulator [Verrucomicrobiota bacterium]